MISNCRRKLGALIASTVLTWGTTVNAQQHAAVDSNYVFSGYTERLMMFNQLPVLRGAILFIGDSLTEAGRWNDIIPDLPVLNRGISGDISYGVLARLEEILRHQPKKIFLMIGVNDLKRNVPTAYIVRNYARIVDRIQKHSPKTKIYLNSILPINESKLIDAFKSVKNQDVAVLNNGLKELSIGKKNVQFIDLYPALTDQKGQLREDITPDGIHLEVSAYVQLVDYLKNIKAL
ncbi:GDSL-type esterase/lipase family protein [Arcticibacter sp.]|jgi:lysophospholipase L1-like esterase|uniref:GDSL-type esterase/lipase family protein n=1 Tax=Arcticibacter sp. TaxID=1872630 RepID=UPI00388D8A5B